MTRLGTFDERPTIALMDISSTVLSFDPDPHETARALVRHVASEARRARRLLWVGVLFVAVAVFLFYRGWGGFRYLAAVFLAFGLLLIWYNLPWGQRSLALAALKKNPALLSHKRVTADVDGLTIVTPRGDFHFSWSAYDRVVLDDLGVTLVLGKQGYAHFVPRRAFSDLAEESAWGEQVSAWVTEASGSETTDEAS
jgi:hypothetical protein